MLYYSILTKMESLKKRQSSIKENHSLEGNEVKITQGFEGAS